LKNENVLGSGIKKEAFSGISTIHDEIEQTLRRNTKKEHVDNNVEDYIIGLTDLLKEKTELND
jgi:hypothetical protein